VHGPQPGEQKKGEWKKKTLSSRLTPTGGNWENKNFRKALKRGVVAKKPAETQVTEPGKKIVGGQKKIRGALC